MQTAVERQPAGLQQHRRQDKISDDDGEEQGEDPCQHRRQHNHADNWQLAVAFLSRNIYVGGI